MDKFDKEDAGDVFGDQGGARQGEDQVTQSYIHIRNQQRNGKKSFTSVAGIANCFNYKKLSKYLKKQLNCNGNIQKTDDFGTVLMFQGDWRKEIADFLYHEGIAEKSQLKLH